MTVNVDPGRPRTEIEIFAWDRDGDAGDLAIACNPTPLIQSIDVIYT